MREVTIQARKVLTFSGLNSPSTASVFLFRTQDKMCLLRSHLPVFAFLIHSFEIPCISKHHNDYYFFYKHQIHKFLFKEINIQFPKLF